MATSYNGISRQDAKRHTQSQRIFFRLWYRTPEGEEVATSRWTPTAFFFSFFLFIPCAVQPNSLTHVGCGCHRCRSVAAANTHMRIRDEGGCSNKYFVSRLSPDAYISVDILWMNTRTLYPCYHPQHNPNRKKRSEKIVPRFCVLAPILDASIIMQQTINLLLFFPCCSIAYNITYSING